MLPKLNGEPLKLTIRGEYTSRWHVHSQEGRFINRDNDLGANAPKKRHFTISSLIPAMYGDSGLGKVIPAMFVDSADGWRYAAGIIADRPDPAESIA